MNSYERMINLFEGKPVDRLPVQPTCNIEPVKYLLESKPEEVYQGLSECHQIVGDKYVVGPGCEVPPLSPYENAHAMMRYADSANIVNVGAQHVAP